MQPDLDLVFLPTDPKQGSSLLLPSYPLLSTPLGLCGLWRNSSLPSEDTYAYLLAYNMDHSLVKQGETYPS